MSAEREESLAEYAMRVTLERDEALRRVRALERGRLEHFKTLDIVRSRSACDWARRAMTNVSPLLSEMEEDGP